MAGSLEEQIAELEAELTKTPYNKATSKHIGRIKAKMAKLRDEAVFRAMKSGGGGGEVAAAPTPPCGSSSVISPP